MSPVWLWLAATIALADDATVEQSKAKLKLSKPPTPLVMPALAFGPMAVAAAERDAFEKWIDATAGRIKLHRDGKVKLTDAELANAIAQLEAASVEWETFFVEGEKNLEFPEMFYRIEFHEYPLYILHPSNLIRQITRRYAEASHTLPDGCVPNSSFFTNTDIASFTPERIFEEFCAIKPRGRMEITKLKKNRTSEGIWVKDATGRKFIVLVDSPFAPEMSTSAEYIGSTLCRMAGFNVPKICITSVEGTGNAMFDGRRAVSTLALKDFKGEYRYGSFRDRREIRGLLIFAAWVSNVDLTEQNTGMTVDGNGVCRHYVFDFGASLGSFTFRPQLSRMGWTRLFDAYQQFTQPLYEHGLRKVPWEAPYKVQAAAIGYFNANLDPDRWQPFYRNMAFLEVPESDRRWMAQRIAQFSDEQIRTVVELAGYTHESDRDYIADTLIKRRDIIACRYLGPGAKRRALP